jgi:hypothetical protein
MAGMHYRNLGRQQYRDDKVDPGIVKLKLKNYYFCNASQE